MVAAVITHPYFAQTAVTMAPHLSLQGLFRNQQTPRVVAGRLEQGYWRNVESTLYFESITTHGRW